MQTERNTPKATPSPLRRAGKVGLSLINPLSDVGYLYRHGVQPVMNNLRRIADTFRTRRTGERGTPVSWPQAVEQTGVSVDTLQRNYRHIRLLWWLMMILTGGFAVMLIFILLVAALSIPSLTLVRAAVTALLLTGGAGFGFVKTAEATWHLWQLSARRVSEAERGTFRDFWAEAGGFRKIVLSVIRENTPR